MANHIGHQVSGFAPAELTESQKQLVAEFQDLLYCLTDANGNRSYSITWLGYETYKWPADIWLYQEIASRMKPDVIIETGTYRGGSALFLACICEMIGHGQVLTIDPDIRLAGERPRHPRITYLVGSSLDAEIVSRVEKIVDGQSKVMVILDSVHTRDFVLEELKTYSRLVTSDGILVVEDSHVNGHPTYKDFGPGPWEAIETFLLENSDFYIDRAFERFLVTANPNGFVRRKAISSLEQSPTTA
jgi:cephalosporin hydroxylase